MDRIERALRMTPAGLVVVLRADQVLAACAARGLSVTQLADAAGISLPTAHAVLTGKPVRPRTAFKIALALSRAPAAPDFEALLEAS
jgi:transcriptional regulator with XRE-family HTH domain